MKEAQAMVAAESTADTVDSAMPREEAADAGQTARPAGKKSYLTLFREERQYLKYTAASVISRFGDSVDSIAYGWMVYELTGSSAWLSIIFAVNALPTILFQPFAGVWVERMDKKKVMVLCDLGRGVIIAVTGMLYLLGALQPWYLLALTFMSSTLESFRIPAGLAAFPRILGRENYDHGTGLSGTLSRVSELVGLAAAGAIIGQWGVGGALIVDGATFFLSSAILMWVRLRPEPAPVHREKAAGYWQSMHEGLAIFHSHHVVFAICMMGVLINAAFVPISTLQTAYVQENLRLGVEALTVAGVCSTLAMGVGSFLYPVLVKRLRRKHLMVGALAVFSLSYGLMVACASVPGNAARLALLGATQAVLGLAVAVFMAVVQVCFMQRVPERYLGRVGSIFNAMATGMTPLTSFLVAAAVTVLAIDRLYGIMGILMLALAVGAGLNRTLRAVDGGAADAH